MRAAVVRSGSGLARVQRLALLLLPALAGAALIDDARAAGCREHAYAVYLSPGFQKGVRWGGYHATLTGFSANHLCNGSMAQALQKAWRQAQGGKPYSFASKSYKKDYQEILLSHSFGKRWGISFKSAMLTRKLAPLLRKSGFEGLKSHWHISLYSDSAKSAVAKFDGELKPKSWKLFLVRLPGKLCQDEGKGCQAHDWTEIK
jgi:hypothetical protein